MGEMAGAGRKSPLIGQPAGPSYRLDRHKVGIPRADSVCPRRHIQVDARGGAVAHAEDNQWDGLTRLEFF